MERIAARDTMLKCLPCDAAQPSPQTSLLLTRRGRTFFSSGRDNVWGPPHGLSSGQVGRRPQADTIVGDMPIELQVSASTSTRPASTR